VRTALFEMKKKLRENGAVLSSTDPDPLTIAKRTGGQKRKRVDPETTTEKTKKIKAETEEPADDEDYAA